jgi:hypothetical protein
LPSPPEATGVVPGGRPFCFTPSENIAQVFQVLVFQHVPAAVHFGFKTADRVLLPASRGRRAASDGLTDMLDQDDIETLATQRS